MYLCTYMRKQLLYKSGKVLEDGSRINEYLCSICKDQNHRFPLGFNAQQEAQILIARHVFLFYIYTNLKLGLQWLKFRTIFSLHRPKVLSDVLCHSLSAYGSDPQAVSLALVMRANAFQAAVYAKLSSTLTKN